MITDYIVAGTFINGKRIFIQIENISIAWDYIRDSMTLLFAFEMTYILTFIYSGFWALSEKKKRKKKRTEKENAH